MNPSEKNYLSDLEKPAVLKNISNIELPLVLLALSNIPEAKAACRAIAKKIRGPSWSWIEDTELFYSALAILAVYTYRSADIDGTCLAHLANKMLACEAEVGGPYYDNGHHSHVLTNLAISKLFTSFGSPLPNVDSFLKSHSFSAPDKVSEAAFRFLSDWPALSFSKKDISKLSTAMPYLAKALMHKKTSKSHTPPEFTLENDIFVYVRAEIKTVHEPLKSHMRDLWNMINQADARNEIKMLPAYFADSLQVHPNPLSPQLYADLGAANIFTWMAYTVYDDFFDDEGQAELLPAANTSLRMALHIYSKMYEKSSDFNQKILQSFHKMDAANSWELSECRFEIKNQKILVKQLPNYGNNMILADRAIGHVLGPLTMVDMLSIPEAQQKSIEKGLRHFLIAKQLSDDLLDWSDDMKKGHINAVVAHILNVINVTPGSYDLAEIIHRMQKYFWSNGQKEISDSILKHLKQSRRYFKRSPIIHFEGKFFLYIFDPLEESVRENEKKAVHQKQFLTTYSGESIKE
jgi:hypothetical protein